MKSRNRPYISQVDELRGAAALLVFFFHSCIIGYWAGGGTGWIFTRNPAVAVLLEGHTGVALFMVLSGFILAVGALDSDVSYGGFIQNRILRIFPLMTFVTFFAIASSATLGMQNILAPFILMQNVQSVALTDPSNIMGTVWTIAIEFQFYLIAPFLFRFVRRDGFLRFTLPLVGLVLAMRVLIMAPAWATPEKLWAIPYFSIAGRLNQFLIGISIAVLFTRFSNASPRPSRTQGAMLLTAALAGMAVLSFLLNCGGGQYAWHHWRFFHPEIEALLWAAVILGYVFADPLRSISFAKRCAVGLGTISFSLYLLHWPIVQLAWKALPAIGLSSTATPALLGISVAVILPPTIVLATLSYWSVERPFLTLRARYVRPLIESVRKPTLG